MDDEKKKEEAVTMDYMEKKFKGMPLIQKPKPATPVKPVKKEA